MQSKRNRKEVEDPQNTWNKQLMNATLNFDVAEAQSLIQKGADPVNAREETPFSKGDLISPLAALLLQGITTSEALDAAQLLIDNGAGLDDMMKLPGAAHFGSTVKVEEVPQRTSSSGRKVSELELQDASPTGSSKSPQVAQTEEGEGGGDQVVETGTVLHYVTALGDHAHLLKILLIAGVPRPCLPQSLMHEVELGVMVPPKPVAAEERASSRKSRSNSLSRRPSRLGRAVPPEGHAPRSSLPPLTAVPTAADGLRLRKKNPILSPPAVEKEKQDAEAPLVDGAPVAHSDSSSSHHCPDAIFDFSVQSSSGQSAVEWAIDHGDLTAARLLMFYGADVDFQRAVNGSQSSIARACSNGDVGLVERLLDAGDTMTQLSLDGRYTLVHYAAAHPPVLEYLSRRGLSLDYENAFGESALVSLIRHGTGRNADHAIREAPRMGDAARLAALPYCAQRNYILTPLPPLVGGFGSKSKSVGKLGKTPGRDQTASADEQKNSIGGREMGTWWAFSLLPTADMIQHLVDCGASVNGTVPTVELGLRYCQFAKESNQRRLSTTTPAPTSGKKHFSNSLTTREDEAGATASLPSTGDIALGRSPLRLTPLMVAIRAYHPELIRKLVVEYHADLAERDSLGATCLHHAAVCPHPSVLELLTSPSMLYTFPTLDLNATDMNGRTPLHYAVAMGHIDTVKLLLAHPTILAGKPDLSGLTPLHLAVLSNEKECIQLLLSHSDIIGETNSSIVASSTAKGGRRQKAAKQTTSNTSNVRQTSAGAEFQMVEVEAEDFVHHCTALEMAIKHHRDPAIVQLLLMEGHATMQRWSGLEDGGSLLHRAVVDNREDYVRILLDNFADPNEPDNEEFTPLYLAVACDVPNIDLIRDLVSAGACSYAQSGTNLCTPLHVAAKQGNAEVLNLLVHIRSGSNNYREREEGKAKDPQLIPSGFFTMTDAQCRTPLHILCAHSDPEIQVQVLPLIEELMKCDSNTYLCTMMDAKGRIPLHEACRAHFEEAVKLLLSVDPLGVYYVDGYGNTPLHDTVFTKIPIQPPLLAADNDPQLTILFMAVDSIVKTLLLVVSQTLPQPLKGLPHVSSLNHVFSPLVSITSQLKQLRRYQNRWVAPQVKESTDCDGTPGEDAIIRSVQQYIGLGDKNGRCAVLLAGELGNVVAARSIVRLAEYRGITSDYILS